MTIEEYNYQIWATLEEWHAGNHDWAAVLRDKWSLASWGQKGGN